MGSGTTGEACKNLNRKFIGIEKEEENIQEYKRHFSEKTVIQMSDNKTLNGGHITGRKRYNELDLKEDVDICGI